MAEPKEPLTERELELVKLVVEGASNKQIAASLFISENTVKVHLKNIFVKLEAESRAKVAAIAQRNGWVTRPDEETAGTLPVNANPALQDVSEVTPAPQLQHEAVQPPAAELVALAIEPPVEVEIPAPRIGERPPVRVVERIVPVPVAPNPRALPPLAQWRRVMSVLCLLMLVLGGLFGLRINRTQALPSDDAEILRPAEAELQPDVSKRWFTRAPLPVARTRSAAFAVRRNIYVIGGTIDRAASDETLIFDVQKNSWRSGAAKPTPLRLAAGAVFTSLIYLPGGTDASGAATARFEAYDTARETWIRLPDLPQPVTGHAVAAVNSRIFVFGGRTSNESFNTLGFIYDIAARRWTQTAGLPTPRSQAAAAAINNRVYVIGGTDGQREYNTCEYFQLATSQWSTCKPMAIARGGLGLARIGAALYAIGGGVANNYIPFNERYDVLGDNWASFETPASRSGVWKNTAVASLSNEFYVIGGATENEVRTETFVFEVLTNRSFLPSLPNDTER
jgi:DNA-binding CsgD family transcriptional regulator/N-acetylneuraminic acid mutarotase